MEMDRGKGALVGLAVGDALGTALEGYPRGAKFVTDIVGGGPYHLRAGHWTDDTSMALCLAEAYLLTDPETVSADARPLLTPDLYQRKLLAWFETGENSSTGMCFGTGATTRKAMKAIQKHGPSWRPENNPREAGNGALMRMAPSVIWHHACLEKAIEDSDLQGVITHGASESRESCRLAALIMWRLMNGATITDAVRVGDADISSLLRLTEPKVLSIAKGDYRAKPREAIRSSGYVIDTLEAALWCLTNSESCKDCLLMAANLGGDADTVAAVAGQFAGAHYSYEAIPDKWRKVIIEGPRIATLAERLYEARF